jgi:hypothetical protein
MGDSSWGSGLFFLFHAIYCSLADYQHRRILAAVASLSLLHARQYHSGDSIIHIFLFRFLLPQKCKASSNVLGQEQSISRTPCSSHHLSCAALHFFSSRQLTQNFPDVVSHPWWSSRIVTIDQCKKSRSIRLKFIIGG